MKNILIAVLSLSLFCSCDAIDDMQHMFEKQEQLQNVIQKKYGYKTNVSFQIHNGTLAYVSVSFPYQDVKTASVAELHQLTKTEVAKVFKSKPEVLLVQIQSAGEEPKPK